jgi:hypothetical protein
MSMDYLRVEHYPKHHRPLMECSALAQSTGSKIKNRMIKDDKAGLKRFQNHLGTDMEHCEHDGVDSVKPQGGSPEAKYA